MSARFDDAMSRFLDAISLNAGHKAINEAWAGVHAAHRETVVERDEARKQLATSLAANLR